MGTHNYGKTVVRRLVDAYDELTELMDGDAPMSDYGDLLESYIDELREVSNGNT